MSAPNRAAEASIPGCTEGLLLDAKAYFFALIGRTEGSPAPDWEGVLAASGIPNGHPPHVQSDPRVHYGITQQVGMGGPRGVLFLPTDTPDDLGYYTRQIQVVDGHNWTWIDRFVGGPPYAPRPCLPLPPPLAPPPTPDEDVSKFLESLEQIYDGLAGLAEGLHALDRRLASLEQNGLRMRFK